MGLLYWLILSGHSAIDHSVSHITQLLQCSEPWFRRLPWSWRQWPPVRQPQQPATPTHRLPARLLLPPTWGNRLTTEVHGHCQEYFVYKRTMIWLSSLPHGATGSQLRYTDIARKILLIRGRWFGYSSLPHGATGSQLRYTDIARNILFIRGRWFGYSSLPHGATGSQLRYSL
jgi:hypothetical protein